MSNETIHLNIEGIQALYKDMPFLLSYILCYSLTTFTGFFGN